MLVALAGLGIGLASLLAVGPDPAGASPAFRPMLVCDGAAFFWKVLLFLFVIGVVLMWLSTSGPNARKGDAPEFFTLLLGATLGMSLMGSASNLLMLFMSVELASLPSYALAGFRKTNRAGAEAALKYVLFGAASSAVMAYGFSILYGLYGTFRLYSDDTAARGTPRGWRSWSPSRRRGGRSGRRDGRAAGRDRVQSLSRSRFISGAPTYLKARASTWGCSFGRLQGCGPRVAPAGGDGLCRGAAFYRRGACRGGGRYRRPWRHHRHGRQYRRLRPDNIKRLLAYSSIAHAGYMLCVISLVVRSGAASDPASSAAQALLLYLAVYLFMNLGAFTVTGLVYAQIGSEEIDAFAGLGVQGAAARSCMAAFLFSLAGLPPLAGFAAKLNVMLALGANGGWWWALVGVIGVNTVLSLYYYARVLKAMYLNDYDAAPIRPNALGVGLCAACAAILLLMLIGLGPLERTTARFGRLYAPASAAAPLARSPRRAEAYDRPETMAPPPVAVLDTLNSLLEAELNSIFRLWAKAHLT